MKEFYLYSAEQALKEVNSSKSGLTVSEAKERLERDGFNELPKYKRLTVFEALFNQFNKLVIYVLLFASLVSFLLGHILETYAILFIVFITVILSFYQEYSADRTMEAIQKLAASKTFVLRDKKKILIPVNEIVIGDIIVLERGIIAPADIRVVSSSGLATDESMLTGESKNKIKIAQKMNQQDLPIADQDNMIFSGTAVTSGSGLGVVIATGIETQIGIISQTIQKTKKIKSPLQQKVDQMSKQVSIVVILISLVLLGLMKIQGVGWGIALIMVGSVIVAGIPESFPLSLTVALSKGVKTMAKKQAILKSLNSVETLGTTTVICSDKTGTITENKMMAQIVVLPSGERIEVTGEPYSPHQEIEKLLPERLLFCCTLCNNAEIEAEEDNWKLIGEPTEGALLSLAQSTHSIDEKVLRAQNPRIDIIPFDPAHKYMITLHKNGNAYLKGAAERVLNMCSYYNTGKTKKTLTSEKKEEFREIVHDLASKGLRIIAVASKKTKKLDTQKYILEGIIALKDPIREDVYDAIKECKSAGIEVIMITGDHKATATYIGKELHLLDGARKEIVEGRELDQLTDEELDKKINNIAIFTRTTPLQKYRIVSSLQRKGHIVAMTGDGVNDAPALKKADIGVAMGKHGTEVAREASDMVLRDDRFGTIVDAVEEGRRIYSNIRRFVYYLLTGNVSQVGIILFAVVLGFSTQLPLNALMILYINFITSTFPALGLSVEPLHKRVMKQNPREPEEPLLSNYIISKILIIAPTMLFGAMFVYIWKLEFLQGSTAEAMTAAFMVMVFSGLFHALNAKKLHTTSFGRDFFSNKWILLAIISSAILTIFLYNFPLGQFLFGFGTLSGPEWGIIIIASSAIVLFSEIIKAAINQEIVEQKKTQRIKILQKNLD